MPEHIQVKPRHNPLNTATDRCKTIECLFTQFKQTCLCRQVSIKVTQPADTNLGKVPCQGGAETVSMG